MGRLATQSQLLEATLLRTRWLATATVLWTKTIIITLLPPATAQQMRSKSLIIQTLNFKDLSLSWILDPIINKIVLFKTSRIMISLKLKSQMEEMRSLMAKSASKAPLSIWTYRKGKALLLFKATKMDSHCKTSTEFISKKAKKK